MCATRVLQVLETWIVAQVGALHRVEQILPVLLADADDRDVAVRGRIDIVRRLGEARRGGCRCGPRPPSRAERHAELRAIDA
jgi:hypothetical protein